MSQATVDETADGDHPCGVPATMVSIHVGEGVKAPGAPESVFDVDAAPRKGGVEGDVLRRAWLTARLAAGAGGIAGGVQLVDAHVG